MKAEEFSRQLQNKRGTTDDIARFLQNRTDNNPNYTFFLGAGCSVTSGIRPASELIALWRSEFCPQNALKWKPKSRT